MRKSEDEMRMRSVYYIYGMGAVCGCSRFVLHCVFFLINS